MEAVVQKWGNSIGIRIPSLYVKELELKDGEIVSIREKKGKIIIQPQKKMTLADLLENVTEENLHEPTEDWVPQGKEEW